MNNLMNLGTEGNTKQTITSREIAELTGKLHKHVMRDIRVSESAYFKVFGGEPNFGRSSYRTEQNKEAIEYILTKSQSLFIVSGYSAELRAMIQKRWEELEMETKLPQSEESMLAQLFPSSDSNLIALSAQNIRSNRVLVTKIEKDAPKVEFSDAVAESKGDYDIGQYAQSTFKELKLGRTNMFKKLRELGYLKLNNAPFQNYIDMGIFKVVTNSYDNNYRNVPTSKTIITGKGQVYLLTRLKKNR